MYESETYTWNRAQQLRVCAAEISYLREAYGVTGWDSENNKDVYERCNMRMCAYGMKCGLVK